jgi:hypothetical protein
MRMPTDLRRKQTKNMNLGALACFMGFLEMAMSSGDASESDSNHEMEAVFLSLERLAIRLDRLLYRLVNGGASVGPDSKREFGIPTKSPKKWKKLADKIKHKEKKRDMRHWKSSPPRDSPAVTARPLDDGARPSK